MAIKSKNKRRGRSTSKNVWNVSKIKPRLVPDLGSTLGGLVAGLVGSGHFCDDARVRRCNEARVRVGQEVG